MEKEHLEILLEDIRGKFELVLEGHDSLRGEIKQTRVEMNERFEHTDFMLKAMNEKIDRVEARLDKKIDGVETRLGNKIDGVAADLAAHRRDTEAHRKGWRVGEGE